MKVLQNSDFTQKLGFYYQRQILSVIFLEWQAIFFFFFKLSAKYQSLSNSCSSISDSFKQKWCSMKNGANSAHKNNCKSAFPWGDHLHICVQDFPFVIQIVQKVCTQGQDLVKLTTLLLHKDNLKWNWHFLLTANVWQWRIQCLLGTD